MVYLGMTLSPSHQITRPLVDMLLQFQVLLTTPTCSQTLRTGLDQIALVPHQMHPLSNPGATLLVLQLPPHRLCHMLGHRTTLPIR